MLRGLSILAVILLHLSGRMRLAGSSLAPSMPPWLSHLLFWNGNNGVTVFFAVSGFLITLTSLRRFGSLDRMQLGIFYRIRFARIAPLLLLLLAVLSILHLIHAEGFVISPKRATLPQALFSALTFHLNWLESVRGYLPANWDVLWSLSIEEVFYLIFPVVCVALLRLTRGMTLFIIFLLILVAMGPLARTIWTSNEIWREKSYLGGMDGIALGCLFALLTNWLRKHDMRPGAWVFVVQIAGVGMMLLIALSPPWHWMKFVGRTGLDGTILSLGTCLVMIATVLRQVVGTRWTSPIRWLGRHSYEVYLSHGFAIVWGTQAYIWLHHGSLPLWFVGIALLSASPGALIARYISEPMNVRLRPALNASSNK